MPEGDTQALRIGNMTRDLRLLAKEFNLALLLVSQLNRENAKTGAAPKLHNLRDSGAIEQNASMVIFVHRDRNAPTPAEQRRTRVDVAKNQDGETGVGAMYFDMPTQKFTELDTTHGGDDE